MEGHRFGFGLIGLGEINQAHIRGYQTARDRAEIVAVCDANVEVAKERGEAFQCRVTTEYRDILDDPRVEAVDITLPHHLHYPVAKAALELGKHVLVEKPMAGTSGECLELIRLAENRGVKFTVAENTRFVTAYLEAERLLRDGILGEPRSIRTFICGSEVHRLQDTTLWKGRKWGTLGGAIFDAGPHSFYLLKWLCGDIQEVQAFQGQLVSASEVEDNAIVAGRLVSGALFSTEYSFTAEIPWDERCEIYGSKGSLIIDQLRNPPAIHYQGRFDFHGSILQAVPYQPAEWKFNSIAEGVEDFIDAICEDRATGVNPWDGYYSVKVAEKAYESVARHGEVIRVLGV